ncbi:MAG: GNAT family N-acetyltransferase [Gammaproteobacteria bacterium]|nr:GNAT family N-acetyltransferase [Gammaproteobacteria bacterium]
MSQIKIAIRPSELEDAEAIFAMVKESIETTYPVQGWCHSGYTLEDAKGWIEHSKAAREAGKEYHFVIYNSDSNRLIGTTSIIRVDQANQLAQTGYFIRESERGKGFAGKACLLTVEYAFRELKLHRLELLIATHNTNSMRVSEKIGAEREGLLKQRIYWDNGIFHDAYLYALIHSEGTKL